MRAPLRLHAVVVGAVAALVLSACGGGGSDDTGGADDAGNGPVKGGTITFLTIQDQINHLDPQRDYTGEDLAFSGAYLNRALTCLQGLHRRGRPRTGSPRTWRPTRDAERGREVVVASPSGRARRGRTAAPITCEDVKYGVSRTFATDLITDGPQYAVAYLDIPKDKDGTSVYKGPYARTATTRRVRQGRQSATAARSPSTSRTRSPDFNFTVTLSAFAPVPKAADTGEKYDQKPVSSGPYKIQEYTIGNQLVLVRNENWDPETDDYRGCLPGQDRGQVRPGPEPLSTSGSSGTPATTRARRTFGDSIQAVQPRGRVQRRPRMAERRTDEFDAYVGTTTRSTSARSPNLQHRQAIAAALDRAQVRTISGGKYAGTLAGQRHQAQPAGGLRRVGHVDRSARPGDPGLG